MPSYFNLFLRSFKRKYLLDQLIFLPDMKIDVIVCSPGGCGNVTLNNYLENNWNDFVKPLRKIMINYDYVWKAMGDCGALRTAQDANLDNELYNKAIRYSRFIRDRYTILDFAGDSNQLEKYIN